MNYQGKRKKPNQIMNSEQLMNEILSLGNIEDAVKQVKGNKGGAGIDGMKVKNLDKFVNSKEFRIMLEELKSGTYKPSPVKMVEIPKPDGGVRRLGIPTVKDRVIQQAINQVLTKIYDNQFSECSFGFRPGIGAHDALIQAEKYVQSSTNYVVDIDLSKFFDTINRDKLMVLLKRTIKDKDLLRLINKYLNTGMLSGEQLVKTNAGTPQGSPLSPLLSNIYLDQIDKELERRNIKFVRYADDIQIYVGSLRSGYRVMEKTIKLLECKRYTLKVNKEKSAVRKPNESKFLGYTFRWNYTEEKYIFSVHSKSIKNLKEKVRSKLRRNRGISIEKYLNELNPVLRGWFNYFRLGMTKYKLNEMDGWIRGKIRVILWKQWKTTKKRVRMQRKFSIRKETCANSRKGPVRVANRELKFSLSNKVLKEHYHLKGLVDYFEEKRNKEKEVGQYCQLTLFEL